MKATASRFKWSKNAQLLVPLLSILLFLFVNSDHKIRFGSTFIAVIPVTAYALVYLVMVFVIGEDAGGWRDHYQIRTIADHLPLPVCHAVPSFTC